MSEVCTYGEGSYGDGHYGICDLINVRGCGPASDDGNPLSTTPPFDPACAQDDDC